MRKRQKSIQQQALEVMQEFNAIFSQKMDQLIAIAKQP
jgi:hypothetical protein